MRFLDLGTLRLEVDGELTSPGGRRPARALSALLMNLNHRVSVELLVDAVWGDQPTPAATGTLESHIWRLRRVIEPSRRPGSPASVLLSDSGGYRLVATPEQVDSARFEQLGLVVAELFGTGQPARALRAAEEALSLWRGTPFEDVADRAWAVGPTSRLQELRAQLLERRVDCILGIGQPARAIAELEPLLDSYPFRERLWSQRMLALYQTGRVEHALDAFGLARRVLREEIGVEPGRDLVDLHRRMLIRDPLLDLAPGHDTEPAVGRPIEVRLPRARLLLDRQDDQDAVVAALDRVQLVTIAGPAGCGKTRLAIEAARAASGAFPDGVWFVDLSDAETAYEVGEVIIATLQLRVPAGHSLPITLAALGHDRKILIVLDNCEQALEPIATLCDALLGPGQQIGVIVTSREPLGIAGELVHAVGPLPLEDPGGGPGAAIGLFLERSGRPAAELSSSELMDVERICRAVDGIPLAIELAAALTPTYGLQEIAALVDRNPGGLRAVGRGQAPHHQTLASAIDRSYRLLTTDERLVHRRLSVLPSEFSRELAEAVVGSDAEPGSVAGVLARLVHRSILAVTPSADLGARFHQLTPIRAHSARLLALGDETDHAEDLRDRWSHDLAVARPRAGRPDERQWYRQVEANLATIRATLQRRLVTRPDALGAAVAPQLFGYWYYNGLVDEGRKWAEAATRVPATAAVTLQNEATLTSFLLLQGLHDEARQRFDRVLAAAVVQPEYGAATAELLLITVGYLAAAGDADAAHRALSAARPIVDASDEADLRLLAEVMACSAESLTAPPARTLARAEQNYAAAMEIGNLLSAWMSCSSVNAVALHLRDPQLGLNGSSRLLALQEQLAGRAQPHQLETLAAFLAFDSRWDAAVRVFAASCHHARRAGTFFPRNQISSDLLAQCRRSLNMSQFDSAWAAGATTVWSDLIQAE